MPLIVYRLALSCSSQLMKESVRRSWILLLTIVMLLTPASVKGQQSGLIVRDTLGSTVLGIVCRIVGCSIVQNLGDPLGQAFLLAPTGLVTLQTLLQLLPLQFGIVSVEMDQLVNIVPAPTLSTIPSQLANSVPVLYYGSVVSQGYLDQPCVSLIGINEAHSTFNISGAQSVKAVAVADRNGCVVDTHSSPAKSQLCRIAMVASFPVLKLQRASGSRPACRRRSHMDPLAHK
jgi:hypothetical protein